MKANETRQPSCQIHRVFPAGVEATISWYKHQMDMGRSRTRRRTNVTYPSPEGAESLQAVGTEVLTARMDGI